MLSKYGYAYICNIYFATLVMKSIHFHDMFSAGVS